LRRWLVRAWVPIILAIAAGFLAQRLFGGTTVDARLVSSVPVATIGSGSEAVAVADDGTVLAWLTSPEDLRLPRLALETPPQSGRLAGPSLEQVKVLAATPAELRPYVEGVGYGESGVDVELATGIELRFGGSDQAARKWRSAAAVLADPSVTALDYVDVRAPGHPATGGSGHTLPPLP